MQGRCIYMIGILVGKDTNQFTCYLILLIIDKDCCWIRYIIFRLWVFPFTFMNAVYIGIHFRPVNMTICSNILDVSKLKNPLP